MIDQYEINSSTLAILPVSSNISEIIEQDCNYMIEKSSLEVMDDSCRYFGSSYYGREIGSKALIGNNYKAPIIVEETRPMIFLPTSSPRFSECSWISLKHIHKYERDGEKTVITFQCGKKLEEEISIYSLENQILRAICLENSLRNRLSSEK